ASITRGEEGGPRKGLPNPPALGAPRVNRGAPRSRAAKKGGLERASQAPQRSAAPSESGGASITRGEEGGPRKGLPSPPALGAPRVNRGAPRSRGRGFARERGGGRCDGVRIGHRRRFLQRVRLYRRWLCGAAGLRARAQMVAR